MKRTAKARATTRGFILNERFHGSGFPRAASIDRNLLRQAAGGAKGIEVLMVRRADVAPSLRTPLYFPAGR